MCVTIDPREHFNLREPLHIVVKVELPGQVAELYREFERELFVEIEGHEIEALNAASKTMKFLQLCNGAFYKEDGWVEVHNAKIDALKDIVEEAAGMPVLVAYQFKSDL